MSIRKATIPAVDICIPTRFTTESVMTMDVKAQSIMAKAGIDFLI